MARILFDVGHPAHVHLFRNMARRLQAENHDILFSALDREMILYLLDAYSLPYKVAYTRGKGKLALLAELVFRTFNTLRIARKFKPDVFVSIGNPTVGIPARLLGKPYIVVTDTEHSTEQIALFKPFATVIATPSVFKTDLGPKHIRYNGFHELAYLHPDEFTPDPTKLAPLGLKPDDRFFVVRFVAWGATHDVGHGGFTPAEKREILRQLAQHGRVLLSVEGDVDPQFAEFVTHFPPEIIHHLLAFATLYIGEGGTMVTECAMLGTPAILVNSLRAGNWDDLRDNYDLLYFFDNGTEAMSKVRDLLAMDDLKQLWAQRRQKMLQEKTNPTAWLVELIKHYFPQVEP